MTKVLKFVVLSVALAASSPAFSGEDILGGGRPAAALQLLPAFARERWRDDLPKIRERRLLRALVTFSKTDFFLADGRPVGLQAELLQQYEKWLNRGIKKDSLRLRVAFIPVAFSELIPGLLEGKGDMATGLLTVTPERKKKVFFAKGGQLSVGEVVVTGKDVKGLRRLEDLSGREVYVLRGSSYVEHLEDLNRRLMEKGKGGVKIVEADVNLVTEDILEMVNAGVVGITVADDYKARLWANILPNLVVRQDLRVHSGGAIGWAVRKNNPMLLKSLNQFAQKVKKGSLVGNILFSRYYKKTKWIKNPLEKEEQMKLARFVSLFKKYGDRYGFDYLAVAAQAYHESGLDQSKRSPKGAVGIMQLLPSTASDPNVGIPHIELLENNIHAGVKYLAFLRDTYFSNPEIRADARVAFAWAAYNAGPAEVRRMQDHAKRMGLDPNKWFNNVEQAALKLVGGETVRYVVNIYKYYVAYALIRGIMDKKAATFQGESRAVPSRGERRSG